MPLVFNDLRTLLPSPKIQLVSFQAVAHSLRKTPGVGVSHSFRKQEPGSRSTRIIYWSRHAPQRQGPMRRRLIRIALILLLFPPLLAAIGGWLFAPGFLTPIRRELTPDLVREADASFAVTHSHRQDFDVRAPDGVLLSGWKVVPPQPNGSWVLLFHGVADNRVGVIGQSEFLLRAGYSVVMMDARAHGASEGPIATYGWLERNDTRAIIDALYVSMAKPCLVDLPCHPPRHIFALGESMGAGIALQSAGADPRIEAVVAESSFANLREAAYDYAGLRKSPLLGKTLFAPGTWTLLYRGEKLTGIPLTEVSPVKAVAARPFPVLLICDEKDEALPCRHTQMIYAAARGPKQFWSVPGAFHTAALGYQPEEFMRRVLSFFATYSTAPAPTPVTAPPGSSPVSRVLSSMDLLCSSASAAASPKIPFALFPPPSAGIVSPALSAFNLSSSVRFSVSSVLLLCALCVDSFFFLYFTLETYNFKLPLLTARDGAALPIPGSAAALSRAAAPPARRSSPAAALRRAEFSRRFSGEFPPAAVPRFREFP
jgi:alpha-beta hydrolase superfamily lysophospholipase